MATMIITIIPVLIVYPFLMRYFVKGIMIGSVKG
jgi:putative aldouronate transport system permease protein